MDQLHCEGTRGLDLQFLDQLHYGRNQRIVSWISSTITRTRGLVLQILILLHCCRNQRIGSWTSSTVVGTRGLDPGSVPLWPEPENWILDQLHCGRNQRIGIWISSTVAGTRGLYPGSATPWPEPYWLPLWEANTSSEQKTFLGILEVSFTGR